jgi:hypothetical protein
VQSGLCERSPVPGSFESNNGIEVIYVNYSLITLGAEPGVADLVSALNPVAALVRSWKLL